MTLQDIDVTHNIWGKGVPYFKRKTNRKKLIPVTGELVQVPKDLEKLNKDIYLTADMFFVKIIPFFINLISKICFTSINHTTNRKVDTIFKAFKDIYSYYMKCCFHITTLHTDGEFPHYKL